MAAILLAFSLNRKIFRFKRAGRKYGLVKKFIQPIQCTAHPEALAPFEAQGRLWH